VLLAEQISALHFERRDVDYEKQLFGFETASDQLFIVVPDVNVRYGQFSEMYKMVERAMLPRVF